MNLLLDLLALLSGIVSLVCWIIILIDAFKAAIWKGILFFVCGFYALFYALFEFEHDNKWLIVIFGLGGGAITAGILRLAH